MGFTDPKAEGSTVDDDKPVAVGSLRRSLHVLRRLCRRLLAPIDLTASHTEQNNGQKRDAGPTRQ